MKTGEYKREQSRNRKDKWGSIGQTHRKTRRWLGRRPMRKEGMNGI